MSHIDEGELTAYADGAYAPEDADAQRIATHIAECANCRNRLAEAQRLSGRASEILAVAVPASMEAPPFEQIAASAPRRTRRRAIPLTWAASIVLAAGLGWFGRDALYDPEAGLQMTAERVQTAEKVASDTSARESAAPMPQRPPALVTPSEADRVDETADLRNEPVAGRASGSITSQVAADAAMESQPTAKVGVASAPAAAAPPPTAAPEPAARRAEAPTQSMAAAAEMADASIEYITPAEAEARKLTLHIVPQLEVVRIGLIGSAVRVEQKLPDGKIVTLETERAAVYRQQMDAANAAKTAEGANAPVSVMRGGTRVTITGALPADSLRALGARIR